MLILSGLNDLLKTGSAQKIIFQTFFPGLYYENVKVFVKTLLFFWKKGEGEILLVDRTSKTHVSNANVYQWLMTLVVTELSLRFCL